MELLHILKNNAKTTMTKRTLYYFIVCMMFPLLMSAQSLSKARSQMDKYNYAKAIETLKKTLSKEKKHDKAIPLLAECYRMQHEMVSAREAYAKAAALPDAKPEYLFYYAQALQATGNYAKAREVFQLYSEKNPSDARGALYMAHCDSVLGPWKKYKSGYDVNLVNNINTDQSEFGPAIYRGALIFASDFNRDRGEGKKYGWTGRGYLNIMKSIPEIDDQFWGDMSIPFAFDSKFNLKYHDGPAAFSYDGNSIYFTRSFYGKAKRQGKYKTNLLKIYYATKADGEWGEVLPFALNSNDYSVGHPALSVDGETLYFVSDMPGGQGGTDIWICKREGENWGPATNLGPTVNTPENEMFPGIRSNGTLYFASDGHPGYGALDIFRTRFENGKWTTPENLQPPINSSFDDFAIAYAPDEENGFFSSNRLLGMGSDDIYALRIAPVRGKSLPSYISGVVRDKTTKRPVEGAIVFLYNHATGMVKILKTDAFGKYRAEVLKPADYIIKAMMPNHIADCIPFQMTVVIPGTTSMVPSELELDTLAVNKTFRIENIYYNFDRYNIREDAKTELDKLVSIMKENAITVELGSHTDSRGSFTYNDKLSQKRAESAVSYIVSAGIDQSRITAKGYGERQLTNKCADGVDCTPEEHQANRRTEFKVTSSKTSNPNPEYDFTKFVDGEEFPMLMFEHNFFANCLRELKVVTTGMDRDTNMVAVTGIPDVRVVNGLNQEIINEPIQPVHTVNKADKQVQNKNSGPVLSNTSMPIADKTSMPIADKTSVPIADKAVGPIRYKVNLYTLSNKKSLDDDQFKGVENVQMYMEDEKCKYTAGDFATYTEASEYKKKLIDMGFEGLFVVAFSDGKRLDTIPSVK